MSGRNITTWTATSNNIAAVRLYTRFGFRVVTTYRYMRLPT